MPPQWEILSDCNVWKRGYLLISNALCIIIILISDTLWTQVEMDGAVECFRLVGKRSLKLGIRRSDWRKRQRWADFFQGTVFSEDCCTGHAWTWRTWWEENRRFCHFPKMLSYFPILSPNIGTIRSSSSFHHSPYNSKTLHWLMFEFGAGFWNFWRNSTLQNFSVDIDIIRQRWVPYSEFLSDTGMSQ